MESNGNGGRLNVIIIRDVPDYNSDLDSDISYLLFYLDKDRLTKQEIENQVLLVSHTWRPNLIFYFSGEFFHATFTIVIYIQRLQLTVAVAVRCQCS